MTPDSTLYLVSLDDTKEYLGLTDDDTDRDNRIGYYITVISELADNYTNRALLEQEHTEWYDGSGTDRMYLNNYPVSAVTSLVVNPIWWTSEKEIESSDYRLIPEYGIIVYKYEFPEGARNVKAVYTAGYSTVPYDLRMATLEYVAQIWQRANEKMWAHESRQGGEKSVTVLREMPHVTQQVWDRYRRWRA